MEDLQAVESMTVQVTFGSGGDHRASVSVVTDAVNAAYGCSTTRPLFCHLLVARCPLPVLLPFPSIFGKWGELLRSPVPGSLLRGSLYVHSIPMAARLRSSSAVLAIFAKQIVQSS